MSDLTVPIADIRNLHGGFTVTLRRGYNALCVPNGAGKTTLLFQLKEYAHKHGVKVFEYSNEKDGGDRARDFYTNIEGNARMFSALSFSSEGEQVALNFANRVADIGRAATEAEKSGQPLLVVIDSVDSGASIDRVLELRKLFELINKNIKRAPVYLVCAVNNYEFVANSDFGINARTGERVSFTSYEEYKDWICAYEKNFPRVKQKLGERDGSVPGARRRK